MSDLSDTVWKYERIVELQKQVIDELFLELLRRVTSEELDKLPCVAKINAAAAIRAEVES